MAVGGPILKILQGGPEFEVTPLTRARGQKLMGINFIYRLSYIDCSQLQDLTCIISLKFFEIMKFFINI